MTKWLSQFLLCMQTLQGCPLHLKHAVWMSSFDRCTWTPSNWENTVTKYKSLSSLQIMHSRHQRPKHAVRVFAFEMSLQKQWKSEYVAYPAGQSSCPGDSVNLLKLSQSKSDQVICAWKPSRAPRTKFRAFCKGFTWYMESSQLARVLSHRTSHLIFLYACKHWLAVYNVQSMLHEHLPLWKMA